MSPKSWIAADDTLHVTAGLVPAIPMLWRAELLFIGITGTSPVMTSEVVVTSESPRAGDDRTGTVMTWWGRTWSWVTPFLVMAGLDPAIPMLRGAAPFQSGSPGQAR